jgi:hypothetical protein
VLIDVHTIDTVNVADRRPLWWSERVQDRILEVIFLHDIRKVLRGE